MNDAHPRLAYAIRGGTHLVALGRDEPTATPASGDDPHALLQTKVGEARLEARDALIFVALETVRDVDRA